MYEKWKELPNSSGQYVISSHGKVLCRDRHVFRTKSNGVKFLHRVIPEFFVPVYISAHGYSVCSVTIKNKKYTKKIHRLVCETFIGYSTMVVNHIDGIKTNNKLSNLEYCTILENTQHAIRTGLIKYSNRKNRRKNITDIEIATMLQSKQSGETLKIISSRFGISLEHCCSLLNGKTKNISHILINLKKDDA